MRGVRNDIPQGSVLGPNFISINDLPVGFKSYLNMITNDAEFINHIWSTEECSEMEGDW